MTLEKFSEIKLEPGMSVAYKFKNVDSPTDQVDARQRRGISGRKGRRKRDLRRRLKGPPNFRTPRFNLRSQMEF